MSKIPDPIPDPLWTRDEIIKLWDNCFTNLYYLALSITDNPAVAEDIVMNNFLKVLEGKTGIKPGDNPCAQLWTWVKNDSLTSLTRKKRSDDRNEVFNEKYNGEPEPDPHEQMIRAEFLKLFSVEIEKLPLKCREVVKLYLEGLSSNEIAIRLNKNENTVRNLITRGRKLLEKRLGNSDIFPLGTILLYFLSSPPG